MREFLVHFKRHKYDLFTLRRVRSISKEDALLTQKVALKRLRPVQQSTQAEPPSQDIAK